MNGTYENIDCMQLMANLKDKEIDLAIVDPPYGIGESRNSRQGKKGKNAKCVSRAYGKKEWDNESPLDLYFKELFRVSKNQIIFGANHYISKFGLDSPCWIVWDKDNSENNFADCELAWTSFNSAVRKFKFKWQGMLQENMKDKEIRIHLNQKPVKLYEWLLTKYAKPNDLILDTHCGSASSLIACENLGFKYVASELDTDYYNQSLQRLKNHLLQGKLFQRVGRDEIQISQPSMFA